MSKILGRGVPTEKTYGILGQEYIDTLTGERYICTKSATVTSDKVGEADHRCEWELEGSGGTGGGLSIKSITFTDRATAHAWFVANADKFLKAILSMGPDNEPIQKVSATDLIIEGDNDSKYVSLSVFSYNVNNTMVEPYVTEIRLTDSDTQMNQGLIGGSNGETHTPDEYWPAFNIKITVYYIGENESEDVGDSGESYESFEVPSSFDNNGDGVPETYLFTTELPEKFRESNAIVVDAVKDITDEYGDHTSAGRDSNYMKYDEVEAGIGTLPAHVYCLDNSSQYLYYTIYAPADGVYELAAYLRIKDAQLRGATYVINGGTDLEHAFVTTYGWNTEEEAFAVRDSQELQGSYMSGMFVHLRKGRNTIRIKPAADVEKNQHFRKLYLVKTSELPTVIHEIGADTAAETGVNLAKGAIMPDYYDMTVTFNNGAPRESDGFCRINTAIYKMSIYKITLAGGQTMPTANSTVRLRGKIGCVNSTVNGSIGKEARIFNATIVEV